MLKAGSSFQAGLFSSLRPRQTTGVKKPVSELGKPTWRLSRDETGRSLMRRRRLPFHGAAASSDLARERRGQERRLTALEGKGGGAWDQKSPPRRTVPVEASGPRPLQLPLISRRPSPPPSRPPPPPALRLPIRPPCCRRSLAGGREGGAGDSAGQVRECRLPDQKRSTCCCPLDNLSPRPAPDTHHAATSGYSGALARAAACSSSPALQGRKPPPGRLSRLPRGKVKQDDRHSGGLPSVLKPAGVSGAELVPKTRRSVLGLSGRSWSSPSPFA